MNIDKYKHDHGYLDEDGCFYENAEDFIMTGILGFCGCGLPSYVFELVRSTLNLIKDRDSLSYEQYQAAEEKLFKSKGLAYFVYYVLDGKGLTEHGGSVPGWLTEEGEKLRQDLNELLKGPETEYAEVRS